MRDRGYFGKKGTISSPLDANPTAKAKVGPRRASTGISQWHFLWREAPQGLLRSQFKNPY
ncbi:MAG TPA: hypothetical protein VE955_05435 [Candidatus Dormibacteraeota bacterium]|nr:hypothetical protein [Candidatus Dormibacteraeota bacterium]